MRPKEPLKRLTSNRAKNQGRAVFLTTNDLKGTLIDLFRRRRQRQAEKTSQERSRPQCDARAQSRTAAELVDCSAASCCQAPGAAAPRNGLSVAINRPPARKNCCCIAEAFSSIASSIPTTCQKPEPTPLTFRVGAETKLLQCLRLGNGDRADSQSQKWSAGVTLSELLRSAATMKLHPKHAPRNTHNFAC